MIKTLLILGLTFLLYSCQNEVTQKNSRVYVIDNSDSIKLQIKTIEENLLPAISVKGLNDIKYTLQERMGFYEVPAVSIAIIDNYEVIWAKGYGISSVNASDSISTSTMFQAASLSKPITSTMLIQLAEKGILDIDEPVNSQLKKWKIPNNQYTANIDITPRMILLHTSGLNIPGFPGYNASDSVPKIIDILNGQEPAKTERIIPTFIPNSKWSYSGGGYVVLQLLLEETTGKTFQQLMQSYILDPLDIENSTFEQPLPNNKYKFAAKGHLQDKAIVDGNWHIYPELAAAGLWTTPFDLASVIVDLQKSIKSDSGKLLRQESAINMLSKHWGDMGLGYLIRNENENTAFTFNGGNVGYRCDFFSFLNNGKGAVIMTNSDNGQNLINEIYRSIAKQYNWSDYNQEIIELKEVSFEKLLQLQANYIAYWPNGDEYKFNLEFESGKLYFNRKDKKYNVVPVDEKYLKVLENGWTLDFSSNADEKMDTIKCFLEFGNTIALRSN